MSQLLDAVIIIEGERMEPMRAIQAATSVAAELLRAEDDIGTIRTGCVADLIGVAGDLLADINVLRDVRFVMQSGAVVKCPVTLGAQLRAGTESLSTRH